MNSYTRRAWAEVDLGAIANNIKNIKEYVGEKTRVLAVVKADAYGHGVVPVAQTLVKNGADCLAVAFIDEAEQLRNAGINCPVLLLGYTIAEDAERVIDANVIPTVFHYDSAKTFSEVAKKAGKRLKIHIKIDSGMNRVGYACTEESVKEIVKISRLDNIEIEGIFTHFACADESSREYTHMQAAKFLEMVKKLEENGVKIPVKHVCNSAGILQYPEYHFDMVRAGIITYGMPPSEEVDISPLKLKAALTLKSRVVRIFDVLPGEKISYGGTFSPDKPMKAAVVSIGYGDGYIRMLSNKATMVAAGHLAKVVGRICMDQCIIDVTNVNNIKVEDEITVAGGQPDALTSFDSLAKLCGTISYELFCLIGKRVPRIYL